MAEYSSKNFHQSEYIRVFDDPNKVVFVDLPIPTYTMCRSASTIASQLELQSLTIWTLSDQESSQASITQGKIGSLLFKEIATQVIKDGKNAVLKLETLLKLITKTKKCSMVDTILSKIRELFKDQDQITIIYWQHIT